MNQRRNTGLDLARCFAMVLVWICHSGYFSVGVTYPILAFSGILAVDIFFVLSGRLIGKSVIAAVCAEHPAEELKRFYVNRVLRIVPMYYLVLLLTALVYRKEIHLYNFLFLNGVLGDGKLLMAHTWTLPVEVWFYLLGPLVLWGLTRLFSRKMPQKRAVLLAIGLMYTVPLLLRIWVVLTQNPSWDTGVRKQVFLRMDSLMLGVAMAAAKIYVPETYQKYGKKLLTLISGVGGIALLYRYYCQNLLEDAAFDASQFWKIAWFTLLPMLCALTIWYLENAEVMKKLQTTWLSKGLSAIATVSYGAYLVHLLIFEQVGARFAEKGFLANWIGFAGAMLLTLGGGFILYIVVEKPCIKLRDKLLARKAETKV